MEKSVKGRRGSKSLFTNKKNSFKEARFQKGEKIMVKTNKVARVGHDPTTSGL